MTNQQNLISPSAFEKLKQKLEELIAIRDELGKEYIEAVGLGDDRENAPFDLIRDKMRMHERKILLTRAQLRTVVVVTTQSTQQIVIGSTVELEDADKNIQKIKIVGPFSGEVNPIKGNISSESPLGVALLGKKVGEKISITLPNGQTRNYVVRNVLN